MIQAQPANIYHNSIMFNENKIDTLDAIKELALSILKLRSSKQSLEKELKSINGELAELDIEFSKIMDAAELTKINLPDIGTFSTTIQRYPRVTDLDLVRPFLAEINEENLIRESVNAQAFRGAYNRYTKSLHEKGEFVPEIPGVSFYEKPITTIRKKTS